MFARPRVKKSVLPPSSKRKVQPTIEQINFDNDARAEYLTGFHKRKVQRQKHAQEIAAKKAREEKIQERKQLREERKQQIEEHVSSVNALLREAELAGNTGQSIDSPSEVEEWSGLEDESMPAQETIDREDEYIDEDRYTTVTVESVSVSKDGLVKTGDDTSSEDDADQQKVDTRVADLSFKGQNGRLERLRKKKQKFRYETKHERRLSSTKQKAKKRLKSRE